MRGNGEGGVWDEEELDIEGVRCGEIKMERCEMKRTGEGGDEGDLEMGG